MTQLTGREYLRVSRDDGGTSRSTEEQHGENARAWEHVRLGEPYADTDRSASRYATKAREDFDRLVGDLRSGAFSDDLLVLWESSRGSRRLSEWALLLELCEERGVKIAVTTHGRVYDLSNGRDRRSLHEDGTDSEYESYKVSSRTRRAAAARAAEGRPHARVPWGYERHYDIIGSKKVFREQVAYEPEAKIVREVYRRVNGGESWRSIVRELSDRGVTNRSGRPFTSGHLRDIILNPTYAGLRSHQSGRRPGERPDYSKAELTPAVWPGIVSEKVWRKAHRRLTDPSRVTTRPGRASHLLSAIAPCGVCGGPLVAAASRGVYRCRDKACTSIRESDLDEYAEVAMIGFLAREDHAEWRDEPEPGAELERAETELIRVQDEREELAREVGFGRLSATLAAAAEPGILERLREAQDRVDALSEPSDLRSLPIEPGPDVEARWKAAPMSARRITARIVLSRKYLGELHLLRSPTRGQWATVDQRTTWVR